MRKSSHESGEEFAQLLASPTYLHTSHYNRWAPFFLYVYDKTIEEMADEKNYLMSLDEESSGELQILLTAVRSFFNEIMLKKF